MSGVMVDDVMLMARVPFWVLNMDSDVLTPEGANNPQLMAPVAPWMVIKKALTRIQMTQSELAHNLGVSRTFMTMLLRGDRPISLEHALAISPPTTSLPSSMALLPKALSHHCLTAKPAARWPQKSSPRLSVPCLPTSISTPSWTGSMPPSASSIARCFCHSSRAPNRNFSPASLRTPRTAGPAPSSSTPATTTPSG